MTGAEVRAEAARLCRRPDLVAALLVAGEQGALALSILRRIFTEDGDWGGNYVHVEPKDHITLDGAW